MNSSILVHQSDDDKYLFIGPRAIVHGFGTEKQSMFQDSIIINQGDDHECVGIFAQATIFVPKEMYILVYTGAFDFNYLIVNSNQRRH